ncbi:MAG: M20/M25/M40 family metallo-hydrolase [Oscillospiraceae bacterium]|nr:M20/M25/M40 family metallo-hydrolase [Oscillospiraceae bacterium]
MIDTIIEAKVPEYRKIWEEICNIESPTAYKPGVDAVGKYITEWAKKKGFAVKSLPQEVSGDPLCITLNADVDAAPIAMGAHMDTVHPVGTFGTPAVRVEGDMIYGPGVCDCKGCVTMGMMVLDVLKESGYRDRPVMLLVDSDEETGSMGSNKATINWMCQQAKDAVAFFNIEAHTEGKAVMWRKGIARFRFTVSGKKAHSGACYVGANAIAQAAHMIIDLEQYKTPDGLTCNCGMISGGTTPNTVPGECTFVADFRCGTDEERQTAIDAANRVCATEYVPGCSATWEQMSYRVAMPLVDRNLELLNKVNSILESAGLTTLEVAFAQGGSDANDATAHGIPAIDNLGIWGGNVHSNAEFAQLDSLTPCTKRMVTIIKGM